MRLRCGGKGTGARPVGSWEDGDVPMGTEPQNRSGVPGCDGQRRVSISCGDGQDLDFGTPRGERERDNVVDAWIRVDHHAPRPSHGRSAGCRKPGVGEATVLSLIGDVTPRRALDCDITA